MFSETVAICRILKAFSNSAITLLSSSPLLAHHPTAHDPQSPHEALIMVSCIELSSSCVFVAICHKLSKRAISQLQDEKRSTMNVPRLRGLAIMKIERLSLNLITPLDIVKVCG